MSGQSILFAGGGTGGHLFPALAVAERVEQQAADLPLHFAVSDRPLDRQILGTAGRAFVPLAVQPVPSPKKPWKLPGFIKAYLAAGKQAAALMRSEQVGAVAALGGFVCGPVVTAAARMRIPTLLVNLDAVPGKANRFLARNCDQVVSVYEVTGLRGCERVGFPLRPALIDRPNPTEARRRFSLPADRPVLLITGASQGARSINDAMAELSTRERFRTAFAGWSVLHLRGNGPVQPLVDAWMQAGIPAKVLEFCDDMGAAWASAELAVSRAGAGSVAEATVAGVPTIYLPYPWHRDGHQKLNARPAVKAGGAILLDDGIVATLNADNLLEPMTTLATDAARRKAMSDSLATLDRGDGAAEIARRLLAMVGR